GLGRSSRPRRRTAGAAANPRLRSRAGPQRAGNACCPGGGAAEVSHEVGPRLGLALNRGSGPAAGAVAAAGQQRRERQGRLHGLLLAARRTDFWQLVRPRLVWSLRQRAFALRTMPRMQLLASAPVISTLQLFTPWRVYSGGLGRPERPEDAGWMSRISPAAA